MDVPAYLHRIQYVVIAFIMSCPVIRTPLSVAYVMFLCMQVPRSMYGYRSSTAFAPNKWNCPGRRVLSNPNFECVHRYSSAYKADRTRTPTNGRGGYATSSLSLNIRRPLPIRTA